MYRTRLLRRAYRERAAAESPLSKSDGIPPVRSVKFRYKLKNEKVKITGGTVRKLYFQLHTPNVGGHSACGVFSFHTTKQNNKILSYKGEENGS